MFNVMLCTGFLNAHAKDVPQPSKETRKETAKQPSAATQSSIVKQAQRTMQSSSEKLVSTAKQASTATKTAAQATESVFVIEQDNRHMGGTIIWISPTHLKLLSKSHQVVTVAEAPDWQIVQFNMRTKAHMKVDLAHLTPYMQQAVLLFTGSQLQETPMQVKNATSIFGIAADDLATRPDYFEHQRLLRVSRKVDSSVVRMLYMTCSKDPKFSRRAGAIVSKLYGLPHDYGFPFSARVEDATGDKTILLKTLSVKTETVPVEAFKPYTEGKRMTDAAKLYSDETVNEDVQDLFSIGWPDQRQHKKKTAP